MPLHSALVAEMKNESTNTRKMLERVPMENISWQPHVKSMTIGRLASHIAETPVWVRRIVLHSEFDFSTNPPKRETYTSREDLLKVFETELADALSVLESVTDETLNAAFTLRAGEKIYFTLLRKVLLRNFAFNHLVHHRGQLSVYLRMLDIAVPGMYGPSADER